MARGNWEYPSNLENLKMCKWYFDQASEVSWIQSKNGLKPAPFSEGLTTLLEHKEDEEKGLEQSIQKVKVSSVIEQLSFLG